jgi:predicted RNA binding protein YcfA (HicA-like mRNA interferase family)
MTRLPVVSGDVAVRIFARAGWLMARQKGSHVMLTKPHRKANLSVPLHRELDPGTLRGLIRDSGMTVAEFVALLRAS